MNTPEPESEPERPRLNRAQRRKMLRKMKPAARRQMRLRYAEDLALLRAFSPRTPRRHRKTGRRRA